MNSEAACAAYRDKILHYIASLVKDPVQAEDLVQETFLRAHRSRDSLKDPAALKAWLYRIATNVCCDYFRRLASPVATPLTNLEFIDRLESGTADQEEPGIDSLVAQGEMGRCVQRLIHRLPETYRLAILLHDVHGLTNSEAAQVLDCSLEAAKMYVHRARRQLKEALLGACEFSRDERGVFVCQPKSMK
jgi:RNA polymerase sigma-70 factor (ECF subfamily)